jgi:hypothetical protein
LDADFEKFVADETEVADERRASLDAATVLALNAEAIANVPSRKNNIGPAEFVRRGDLTRADIVRRLCGQQSSGGKNG